MKATPLIIHWHEQNVPIYSAHFEPHGKGRLATGGGDTNVRIWRVEGEGEERKVEYLSTLRKHTQAVNVVRWAPKGELIASAGDDGNVILWVPSENQSSNFGNDDTDDKEFWRTKHMCRASGVEIYDLAWSPDSAFFIIGSMDNIARIYNAVSGQLVRQIAEHSHYVQGVAWDPLNEFIATQSSDRSVHIYSLKTKDGHYTLSSHGDDRAPTKVASHNKTDLPPRRLASASPAPSEAGNHRAQLSVIDGIGGVASMGSPVPSAPGTPTSMALPMNPPSVISHSRRSSFSSRRSPSPAPSMPLPAVMPIEASPKPPTSSMMSMTMKNASLYANETLTSFFRRLTFTPDGSLLLTPAGQYQTQHQHESGRPTYEVINTVYIYTRGGINKTPIAHLPGHKKPSVVVRCSPVVYTLRQSPPVTKNITIDTASAEEAIPSLPDPISRPSPAPSNASFMEPPPPPAPTEANTSTSKTLSLETSSATTSAATSGPKPTFALPYRMIYAVATQDSVLLYDTQQQTPICIVSNLHCATFTDLAWSNDGLTLLISSSDGYCSTLSFVAGELGTIYTGELQPQKRTAATDPSVSAQNTPVPTPTSFAPPSPFPNGSHHQHRNSASSFTAPSPPPAAAFVPTMNVRPSSPARSNSVSSIVTQTSTAPANVVNNPPLMVGSVPSITAANSGKVTGVPITTPPETPRSGAGLVAGTKRDASESERDDAGKETKKRRIAPTLLSDGEPSGNAGEGTA